MPTTQEILAPRNRSAVFSAENLNEENRTVTLSFASEEPVRNWWGDNEILRCNAECMETNRLGVMPVLFNHERDEVIGQPLKIWFENNKAYAEIKFDDDEKSIRIMNKVKSGSLRGVSVGYRIKEYTVIKRGETNVDGITGPAVIATRWEVFEISIVSVPADPTVGVNRSLLSPDTNQIIEGREEPMGEDQQHVNLPDNENQRDAQEATRAAERERCSSILAICNQFGIEEQQRDAWINNNTDINAVRSAVLDILAQRNQPQPTAHIEFGEAEEEKKRAARRDAYAMRCGIQINNPAPGAESLRHMSMRDMAREMLFDNGETGVLRMDDTELFHRAMTTSTLPTLLNDVTQVSLASGYNEAETTFEQWTRKGSLPDFRVMHRATMGTGDLPILIPQNGEFTDVKLSESKVGVKLDTYGRQFTYSRQSFVNDDHQIIIEVPRQMGRGYKTLINQMVYKELSTQTYTAGVNKTTSGSKPSSESMSEMTTLLRKTKGVHTKRVLNITPKFMVVPAGLEFVASQLLASTADPAATHSGVANVYRNAAKLIVDATLDEYSPDAWYLLGAPVYGEGIEVNYLNGIETPNVRSFVAVDTLGWIYQTYFDFNVKALSTVGYVQNVGK